MVRLVWLCALWLISPPLYARVLYLPQSISLEWKRGFYPEVVLSVDNVAHSKIKIGDKFEGRTLYYSRDLANAQKSLQTAIDEAVKQGFYVLIHQDSSIEQLEVPITPTFSSLKQDFKRVSNEELPLTTILDTLLVLHTQYDAHPGANLQLFILEHTSRISEQLDAHRKTTRIAAVRAKSLVYLHLPEMPGFRFWVDGKEMTPWNGRWWLIKAEACTRSTCPKIKHRYQYRGTGFASAGEGEITVRPNAIQCYHWDKDKSWLVEITDPKKLPELTDWVPFLK